MDLCALSDLHDLVAAILAEGYTAEVRWVLGQLRSGKVTVREAIAAINRAAVGSQRLIVN